MYLNIKIYLKIPKKYHKVYKMYLKRKKLEKIKEKNISLVIVKIQNV